MNIDQLADAYKRIEPVIHRTPVHTSTQLNKISGAQLFFKCENFQRMGAFKIRGASNAILQLHPEQKELGVVTHSSGNFAQALSLAAQSLGVKATIVMPFTTPKVKKDAVRAYGGIIIECDSTNIARASAAQHIVDETGATFIHPSNNLDVILGNGTATVELLDEHPDLKTVIAPVGGGGLIAGTALAAQFYGNDCSVIGGEPEQADDAYRSMISGKIESNISSNTIADGLKTQLGDINFPIILNGVERIITVSEEEIVTAMRLVWERMKLVIEPSSAVAFAALLKERDRFANTKVGIIISGGNVDLSKLPF